MQDAVACNTTYKRMVISHVRFASTATFSSFHQQKEQDIDIRLTLSQSLSIFNMALCASVLQSMDPLTLTTALQLHLEDTEQLTSRAKGKGREGTVSDAELALQMYVEELNACNANLADRKMAQSMALAVIRDAQIMHQENLKEQQAIRDRELAAALQAEDGNLPQSAHSRSITSDDQTEAWEDPEMLSKVAAIYMKVPEEESPPQLIFDSDSDCISDKPLAESSKWAATRKTKDKPMMGRCVACGDEKEFFEVARVPCKNGHEYCRDCLAQLFRLSMTDETLFPPRCCSEPIPLGRVRFFLPSDLAKDFEAKEPELNTKNRTYCHDRTCSAFIPADAIQGDIATCCHCRRTTCTMCKQPSHTGDCPEDTALQQLLDTADAAQWQRCYQCTRVVELDHGCNHMTYAFHHNIGGRQSKMANTLVGVRAVPTSATSVGDSGTHAVVPSGMSSVLKHVRPKLPIAFLTLAAGYSNHLVQCINNLKLE